MVPASSLWSKQAASLLPPWSLRNLAEKSAVHGPGRPLSKTVLARNPASAAVFGPQNEPRSGFIRASDVFHRPAAPVRRSLRKKVECSVSLVRLLCAVQCSPPSMVRRTVPSSRTSSRRSFRGPCGCRSEFYRSGFPYGPSSCPRPWCGGSFPCCRRPGPVRHSERFFRITPPGSPCPGRRPVRRVGTGSARCPGSRPPQAGTAWSRCVLRRWCGGRRGTCRPPSPRPRL